MSRLGVVVFGAGIAGKVRIRDIGAVDFPERTWTLAGFVSRRDMEIEGACRLTEEEAFSRADINAVVVCTENNSHERIIRNALKHGKHVLVEYPVATNALATRELFELAEQKGVILHEENIALLTTGFQSMRDKLAAVSQPIVKGEIKLNGSYNGWVEDFMKSGGPFCVNVTLIQSVYELLGKTRLQATGGQLDVSDEEFTATAELSCDICRDLTLTVRRTKQRSPREKVMRFTLADGTVIEETPEKPASTPQGGAGPKKPGLFMEDFLQFVGKVQGTIDPSADMARTLHCIQVAADIHGLMGLAVERSSI